MEEQDKKQNFFHHLKAFLINPHEALTFLGKDRYQSLRTRLFLMIGALAGVPLLIVLLVGFFWLRNIFDQDMNNQLRWQIEDTRQSVETFLREKISGLRFLVSVYSYEQLSAPKTLDEVFLKRKREFSELVDLGVIDNKGVQRAYAGPYELQGKDYSKQEWFQKVMVKGVYVSDVYTGYRGVPHFSIAVKHDAPGSKDSWVVRATIEVDTLTSFLSALKLKEYDDAFIINGEGILQTPSRFSGKLLERYSIDIIPPRQDFSILRVKTPDGVATFGCASIKDSPWVVGAVIKSSVYSKMFEVFKREMVAIYLVLGLIIVGILMNLRTVRMVVDWIEDADRKREEAISETEHSAKLASIGRLAAGVAHEINNPLAVINEKAGLMKDLLQVSSDTSCRDQFLPLLKGISDSVVRCRTITQRLLGFARRMDVKIEAIDVNDAIKEVVGFLERELLYRNINLERNFNDKLPRIHSDRGQLQQVFLNIINNGIDAVKDGGLITVTTVPDGEFVRVMIRDNGHGIPREVLKHIFEPFYTTKAKGKGTGLGLSLSYGIIQRLGGTLQVDSVVNKGTTFIIKLPIQAPMEGIQQ